MKLWAGFAAAVVLSAAVAFGIAWQLTAPERAAAAARLAWADAARNGPMRQIIVFSSEVPAGTKMGFDHVAQRSVPAWIAEAGALAPADASRLMGQTTLVPGANGDAVLASELASSYGPGDAERLCEYLDRAHGVIP